MKTPEEQQRSRRVRGVTIEGFLYWYTAFASGLLTYLASEESYKYLDPQVRFWAIAFLGSTVTGFNAVKAFRSMTYGRNYNQDNPPPGGTEVIPKP